MAPPGESRGRCASCCTCCPVEAPRSFCGLLGCFCGCDLTTRDFLRLLPCLLWCFMSILSSVLHVVVPVCDDRFPATMPMFWGWLSALPASVCAVLIMLYHRDSIQERGFSKETARNFGLLYGFISVVGCFVYFTFVFSAIVMVFRCNAAITAQGMNCDPGNFGYNAFWFFMTVTWLIFQSCLTPRARFIEELILKHEQVQAAAGTSLAVMPGSPAYANGAGATGVSVHPTVYGNPAGRSGYETPMVYGSPTEMTGPATYAKTAEASN
ncbi:putative transmembrane protein [Toxoplasma gondii TgCatPRC2]|uniref:Transmembrane protein n=13 Tax=Toxoplasma gondii TaxID=5811 RepID=A0A125YS56_TOXGG|nr:hypothetical protein TGME49_247780 [Toxoplasma gondii ME49]EPR63700.1 hypothetical protein TGGT1_247780 [Toxoplasma gondii GT1]ESS34327.1 putative transmembrane protein [Toxoplasma gondii VEG]KAF4638579.1 hypothetical protein TGRH88_061870 [Toxoplasma gondii]KFG46721.1 putative transmembrane protein [Toxoplasma gondii GAB2-2007-GAL-DOM2]KFG48231.1 putative transmembrane protein [Toxoplasma gondii p89]KFG54045.1 putative transmembrane protein [Toxoplasma gondii FOU]KFG64464.1 putative tran|eukprot:XP_018634978.1 hypothetical protein TGME49_247780 [Toxoplasma gondii ME49]